MSKKTTAEKKLRRKQNQEQKIRADRIQFDVLLLLNIESLQTKPEVGDFLKKYVKSIRLLLDYGKLITYPVEKYSISKVFIDFLDDHQIIVDYHAIPTREYYLYNGIDEIDLKDKDKKVIVNFIQKLQEFQFLQ